LSAEEDTHLTLCTVLPVLLLLLLLSLCPSSQNALSPGQIFLTIHLLDTFGFAVDAIGQHIPPSSQRGGSGFMIGPVKVAYEGKN
jgi:hypothetical protein